MTHTHTQPQPEQTVDQILKPYRDNDTSSDWQEAMDELEAALNRQALTTALRIVDSLPVLGHIDSKTGTRGDYVSVAKLRQVFTDYYGGAE